MRPEREEPILTIRKSGAAVIVAFCSDGTEKKLAIPKAGHKNRWSVLADAIASVDPWKVECYDAKEILVGTWESDEPSDDDDDAPGQSNGDVRLAKIMTGLLRDTMAETRKMFETQMRGNAELVTAMTEGMRTVQESYLIAMRVQATTTAGGSEPNEMQTMMQAAMLLMQNQNRPPPPAPPQIQHQQRQQIPVVKEVKP